MHRKAICLLLLLCIICSSFFMSGCTFGTSKDTSEETEPQTIPIDEEYGKGVSFSFVDHTGEYNLDFSIRKNETENWVLRMTGDNSLYVGTKYITDDEAQQFFYYILNNTSMKSLDKYNKTGDSIKESKWYYSLNVSYEKNIITSYGYMSHPAEYDSFRIAITEYLNDLFVNTQYKSET